MTETPPVPAPVGVRAAKPPADTQLVVALAIVGGMVAIALTVIIAAALVNQIALGFGIAGTIVGALATALNTPTGVSNALKASAAGKGDGQ